MRCARTSAVAPRPIARPSSRSCRRRPQIVVNTTYPVGLPLATFPARLLQKLPALPPELEYRIVGHHIVLRDVTGNVIVDVARNIVPTIPS